MWEQLIENLIATTWIERIAFISLTLYVILATRQIPLAWPVSMVGVVCYFYLALDAQLYAELPLQVFYFFISIYGWYKWKFGGKAKGLETPELPVSRTSTGLMIKLGIIGVAGTLILGMALDNLQGIFTFFNMHDVAKSTIPTDVPYWDAGTTVFSLIGTWMQAKKKVENWIVWLVVDTVYVGLFIYKDYILLSVLNVLYLGFATYGLYAWYNSMKAEKK